MAPTKEEEVKLRDYSGDLSKLGTAERFLKTVLDIPFAFKRVDAMLYRANFETETNYLRKSFETLEVCEIVHSCCTTSSCHFRYYKLHVIDLNIKDHLPTFSAVTHAVS
jgi:hypothetical protein